MLYIRVDMNEKIATGHLMRCLSIADAARKQGEDTTFIFADTQAEKLVQKKGYQSIVLNSTWNMLETELDKMIWLICEENIKILFIDSYYVTFHYLEELNKHTHVIYLDDRNAFYYPVTSLLCYAPYYEIFRYSEQYGDIELLLGTKYVPLRAEFSGCREKHISSKIENILIMSGGTDEFDVIDCLLENIDKNKYRQICAICGIYYNKYNELTEKYKGYSSVKIVRAASNIKEYMEKADIAISAAGTTLYELAATGTPTISYTIADNQLANAFWWDEKEIILYAGDVRKNDIVEDIKKLLNVTYESSEYRQKCSCQMQKYVDGNGAERIVQKLMDLRNI